MRLYKTRSMATDACKKGQVTMNGTTMKPSKSIKEGDVVSVRKPPITYTFRVLKAIERVLYRRTAHSHLSILASILLELRVIGEG